MIATALIVTKRDLRDSLSDWRISTPILILTFLFPWLMLFGTDVGAMLLQEYNPVVVFSKFIPFSAMIVGFFPISFSLIIALETFVGERERNSIEPLLAMPISDRALYLGKLLASLLPPLIASFLGITIYAIGLRTVMDYAIPPLLLTQVYLLAALEAVVMVTAALVISSHSASVRAANLLASFVIVPMSLVVQTVSLLVLWERFELLWSALMILVVVDIILLRLGMRIFNREELLSHQAGQFKPRAVVRTFWRFLLNPPSRTPTTAPLPQPFSIISLYRRDIPRLLRLQELPIAVTFTVMVLSWLGGWFLAWLYPFPADVIQLHNLSSEELRQGVQYAGLLPDLTTLNIFLHNVRALLIGGLLAVFTFGAGALLVLMLPIVLVGFLTGQAYQMGYDPFTFTAAFILPHGVFELSAVVLTTAFSLRLGASLMAPPPGFSLGQSLLLALAEFVKILALTIPLLFLAAFVEANITPQIAIWLCGR